MDAKKKKSNLRDGRSFFWDVVSVIYAQVQLYVWTDIVVRMAVGCSKG